MNDLIKYFSNVPDSHRVYLLAICLFIFGNIELFFPFKKSNEKIKHILVNSLFMLPALPVQLVMGFILVFVMNITKTHHFGLLNIIPVKLNSFSVFMISFVLLDFFEYVYHRTMHKVKQLWMVHLVHHSDRELTVATTLREHPIETAVRLGFLVIWVFIVGVGFWALLFRQFIQIISNVFAHSNFRLHEKVDRVVSFIFVTPNMHQIHHHYKLPHTDTNYGDVLSIWDRLFGTFMIADSSQLKFGVDTHFDKNKNTNFFKLLKIPFENNSAKTKTKR